MMGTTRELFSTIWGIRTFNIQSAIRSCLQAVSAISGKTDFLNDQNFSVAKTKPSQNSLKQLKVAVLIIGIIIYRLTSYIGKKDMVSFLWAASNFNKRLIMSKIRTFITVKELRSHL
jgi:hypothetical protein